MMDLAEIRKKARCLKERDRLDEAGTPRTGSRPVSSIQGTPPEAPPSSPAASNAMPDSDPLEALFRLRPDLELATEESYLQGVAVRDEEGAFRQCLAFSLGDEEYALDIGGIREIIKPREITDVPRVPDFILGIISLRGSIIPVFDLKQRLNLGKTEVTALSRIVVCHHNDRFAGLLVDRLNQVVLLPGHEIEPPPAVLSGLDREMVEGVGRYRGRMMILLNLSCVVETQLN